MQKDKTTFGELGLTHTLLLASEEETIAFGKKMAMELPSNAILALYGDLGAGKTTFVQGLALGLHIVEAIQSPTFILLNDYGDRLYHFDLYRLDKIKDIEDLDSDGYFFGKGISVIEWADKCRPLLPKTCIRVEFKIKGENEREIQIS